MAARKRNWLTDKSREKIRASINTGLLVKRFEDHVLKSEGEEGYVKLTTTQIKAGEVLLQRTMPALSSAEIVEQEKESGINESMDRLIQLLGPEVAKLLTQKDGLQTLRKMMEKPAEIIHEQPEKAQ